MRSSKFIDVLIDAAMSRLLEGAQEWADVEGFKELADRITDARYAYNVTITAKGW
jgi:hypothetical protein